ncbi:hypothetical protein [Frankia sp. Cppng1_Ct_nod]|uniref:hypothetical protein n=1 Tax=Frankia sp. Cppng1_Ct_nod TaxID=2897162 RepID=UPI0013EFBE6E|nr:hypothetical protein [Frankia sp. Cppng1_Ct_nod]
MRRRPARVGSIMVVGCGHVQVRRCVVGPAMAAVANWRRAADGSGDPGGNAGGDTGEGAAVVATRRPRG